MALCSDATPVAAVQKFLGSSWPEQLGQEWQDLNLEFQYRTHEVALKLLQAMAVALGRDEQQFLEVRCVLLL